MANPYQQMIDSYAAQQREKENLLKQQQASQANNLKAQVDNQISQLNQSYEENARQAYIQKMMSQRDLPQQLAAQGVSGGLSESGNIALNTAYGNQLGGYKNERDSNLSNVNLQYNNSLNDLNNTYLGKIADNKTYYDSLISQQKAAKIQAEEQARQAAAAQRAAIQAARSGSSSNNAYVSRAQSLLDKDGRNAYDYLKNLLSSGYISGNDFSKIAAQIGLTDSMIRQYNSIDSVVDTVRKAAQVIANRKTGLASVKR